MPCAGSRLDAAAGGRWPDRGHDGRVRTGTRRSAAPGQPAELAPLYVALAETAPASRPARRSARTAARAIPDTGSTHHLHLTQNRRPLTESGGRKNSRSSLPWERSELLPALSTAAAFGAARRDRRCASARRDVTSRVQQVQRVRGDPPVEPAASRRASRLPTPPGASQPHGAPPRRKPRHQTRHPSVSPDSACAAAVVSSTIAAFCCVTLSIWSAATDTSRSATPARAPHPPSRDRLRDAPTTCADDRFHARPDAEDELDARADLRPRRLDQRLDLLGRLGRALGETAHLLRHHRKAPAGLPGARGLDARVQGEKVRLEGDLVDDADDVAIRAEDCSISAIAETGARDDSTAALGLAAGGGRRLAGGVGARRRLADAARHHYPRRHRLLQIGRLLLGALGEVARRTVISDSPSASRRPPRHQNDGGLHWETDWLKLDADRARTRARPPDPCARSGRRPTGVRKPASTACTKARRSSALALSRACWRSALAACV